MTFLILTDPTLNPKITQKVENYPTPEIDKIFRLTNLFN